VDLVPVGFIYVQLPFHQSPELLWPAVTWKNVTAEYAGLFFRAGGGTAADFGEIQEESDNRLITVRSGTALEQAPLAVSVPTAGISEFVFAGYSSMATVDNHEIMSFENSGGETRPRNAAVLVWERI